MVDREEPYESYAPPQDTGAPDPVERDPAALNSAEGLDEDELRTDPLEAAMDPPEHWSAADRYGTTPWEQAHPQPLDERLAQEQPDTTDRPAGEDRPTGEDRTTGEDAIASENRERTPEPADPARASEPLDPAAASVPETDSDVPGDAADPTPLAYRDEDEDEPIERDVPPGPDDLAIDPPPSYAERTGTSADDAGGSVGEHIRTPSPAE